jgi:hypothetical protein
MDAFDKADGVAAAAASLHNQADTMIDAAYLANRTAVQHRRRMAERAATRPFMPGWDGSLRAAGGYCPRDDVTLAP